MTQATKTNRLGRRSLGVGIAVVTAFLSAAALPATPAAAVDGDVYARAYTKVGEDRGTAGGSVRAYIDFRSRRTVWVRNVVLNDICPGDGNSVYWQFGVRMIDGTEYYTDTKHRSSGECGSPDETWDKVPFSTDLHQIDNVYLKVCVDQPWYVAGGDDCKKSNEHDNPFTGAS